MYNPESIESIQTLENCKSHFSDNIDTQTTQLVSLQQLVKVDSEQLKGQAYVRAEKKVVEDMNHIQRVFSILIIIKILLLLLTFI